MNLRRARAWIAMFLGILPTTEVLLLAADPPAPNEQSAGNDSILRYRRIFVPKEDLDSQAKGMIPLRREEFERRVAAWTHRAAAPAAKARLMRATYAARLSLDQWVEGIARLDVVSNSEQPVVFPWGACSLALGKPTWDEQPPRAARLGTTPEGEVVLVVEKTGQLVVPWTQRGKIGDGQELIFDIRLPAAALSRLVLQVPSALSLAADAGISSRLDAAAPENGLLPAVKRGEYSNWLIEPGGESRFRLKVTSAAQAAGRERVVLVREAATHVLTPADATSEFTLQLDVHDAPLSTLQLSVDAGARVIGARLAGVPLAWHVTADAAETAVEIPLPGPLAGAGNVVTVNVVTPLALNRAWRLPRMKLHEGTWQEGTAAVVVPEVLRMQQLGFRDARQTSLSPGSATQPEQMYQFQYHSAQGNVELRVGRALPQLHLQGGLVVRHEGSQLAAVLNLDLGVDAGERFDAEGIVQEDWSIDSVETVPPDLLEERHYAPIEGRSINLRLRFARPLTARGKTRLVIRAHRQLPAEGEGISAQSLRLVQFKDLRSEQWVAALRATDGSREFQPSGDLDLFRIDPESAGADELSLLESSSAGILFRLDRQVEASRIGIVPGETRFHAAIESIAKVQPGKVLHQATARINPLSSSLTRLLVRASEPVPVAMRWKLTGANDLSITSQTLLPTSASLAGNGDKESVWELVLSRAASTPLLLEAAWEAPFASGGAVPLFSFPEAAGQEGLLRVEAAPGVPLRWESEGAKAAPAPLPATGEYSSLRGVFRYEPGRSAIVSLSLQPKSDALAPAWVRRCTLKTRFEPGGSAAHEITWELENHGLDRFPFSLPEGALLKQVSVDGQPLPVPSPEADSRFLIPLPARGRFPRVSLSLLARSQARGSLFAQGWQAPLVTTQLPVLERHWKVTLPRGIERLASGESAAESRHWHAIWQQRLWGKNSARPSESELDCPWIESQPLVIWVYSPAIIGAWAAALAIAAASLALWWAPRGRRHVASLAALSACLALVLPLTYSPLAAGVFWGLCLGGIAGLVRARLPAHRPTPRDSRTSVRTALGAGAVTILLLAIVAGEFSWAEAAAPEVAAAPDAAAVPSAKLNRVVIPIDSDRQPVGDYVYVPLDFYTFLYRAPQRELLPPWLIRSAIYELEAAENGMVGNISARFEIESLVPSAKISLPLRRGEIHLLEGRATLDGAAMPLDWDEAGTSLRFEMERPGLSQLTLGFSAAAKTEGGAAVWSFTIPQTSRSTLRVKGGSRGEWHLPAALGAVAPEGEDLLADLGSAAAIELTRGSFREASSAATESEQFVWWKIRPGSVSADFVIRIRPEEGLLREIQIVADPRLRLLPLENDPRFSRVWVQSGDANTHHFALAEPAAQTVELRGKFLLMDSSGIGKFVLPRLEAAAQRRTTSWHAISVSKDCEIFPDPQPPLKLRTPVEFVDAWGGAPRPPTLAIEATGPLPAFLIRTKEGVVSVRESIDISLGRSDAVIVLRADMTGIPPQRFQEILDLPPGFRLKSAALQEQDVSVSLLSQTQPGLLTIQRAQMPAETQRLVLEGTISLAAPYKLHLPELQGVTLEGTTIRLYRTSEVLAQVKTTSGLDAAAVPEGPPWDARLGYLMSSFKSNGGPGPREIELDVRPNTPSASYRLITRMERTGTRSWSAALQCNVQVERGELDSIRVEIPAEWSGPFEFTPPMDHQVVLLPGQTQRHLVIRPPKAVANSASISIRSPVRLPSAETPRAPVLLPLDAERVESLLLLPSRINGDNLRWQTTGLQSLSSGEVRDEKLAAKGFEAFRVVAPRFDAALLPIQNQRKTARIAAASFLVHSTVGGDLWAQADYFLLPGGRTEVEFKLPSSARLVKVLVNESSAECRAHVEGSWIVRLSHDQLPQKLTVIFEQTLRSGNSPNAFEPPRWPGIVTAGTSYTLHSPWAKATHNPEQGAPAGSRKVALEKMADIIRLLQEASDLGSTGLPAPQLADWLAFWRLEFSRADNAARSSSGGNDGEALEIQRRSLEAEFSAALSRYSDLQASSNPPALPPPEVPFQVAQHFLRSGEPAPLLLEVHPESGTTVSRLSLAALLLFAAGAIWPLQTIVRFGELLARWPAFSLALLGIVSLALTPFSWLAALPLFAASLWFSLRRTWPARQVEGGSQVIRSGAALK